MESKEKKKIGIYIEYLELDIFDLYRWCLLILLW